MRGAPITVRCDCGDSRPLPYGERWTCTRCGRTWDTAQIPAEEYWGAMRGLRRYRLLVWLVTGGVVAVFVPLAVAVNARFSIVVILVLGAFYFLIVPTLRRRALARMRDRPSWKLHPE